ncbi:MAG: RDD family protein [Oscillospiraceae bacterium]|nr:RDD family protein [Oscillospiraceae bacterium]
MRDNGNALRPARFWPRAAAFLLDRALLWLALLAVRLPALFSGGAMTRDVLFRFSWLDILGWALITAYFTALTACTGATLGKKAMGLRVVTKEGKKVPFLTVLWRESFARYLSGILCIGYLLCAADPENGTLHDRICDTRVVYTAELPDRTAPALLPVNPVADPLRDWYAPYRK